MLGDTKKEIRFAYVGLAVASTLIARRPELVESRRRVEGRVCASLSRATITILGEYTQRKREFNEADYDSTLPVVTAEGWVGDDIIKEDVAMRAELVNVPAPSDSQVFRLQHSQENLPRSEKRRLEADAVSKNGEEHHRTKDTKDLCKGERFFVLTSCSSCPSW